MNSIIGVIPARYQSTRFPGKPLHLIFKKPMIQWTIEGALSSQKLNHLIVATDDTRILDFVTSLKMDPKVSVVMTSSDLATGTDRVYAAVKSLNCEIVLNIQGDEPLIQGTLIDSLIENLQKSQDCDMASVCHPLDFKDLANTDIVKVIENVKQEAIYFSRFPIPFSRVTLPPPKNVCYRHVGIYAFRKKFLETFCNTPPSDLEIGESLEQLRALHLGGKIKMTHVDHYSQGVDRPQDIARIEKILKERKL